MRVRLTREAEDAICMESPYEARFVTEFKMALPWDGRAWQADRKRWIVSALYAVELLDFLQRYGAIIQDDRHVSVAEGAVGPAMPDDLRQAFDTLHLAYTAPLCVAEASYKALATYLHPDKSGDATVFSTLVTAMSVVRAYLAPRPFDERDLEDDIPF